MSIAHREIFTCDGCGMIANHELLQKERLPKYWVFVEIINSRGKKECFHLCSRGNERLEWLDQRSER